MNSISLSSRAKIFVAIFIGLLPTTTATAKENSNPSSSTLNTQVQLSTSQERLLSELPVRVFRESLGGKLWVDTKIEATFNGKNCNLQLPEGDYQFEILAEIRSGELLCVRSKKTTVSEEAVTVTIPVVKKHRVQLKHDGRPQTINQIAIASLGKHEARWQSKKGVKVGTILAEPEKPLSLNLIGGNEKLIIAGWGEFKAQKKIELSTTNDWQETIFKIDSKTPRLKKAHLELLFPTTSVDLYPDGPLTLITNRRVARIRYDLTTTGGQQLVTRESLIDLEKSSHVSLGGLLHVEPWATILSKGNGKKSLRWESTLLDAKGREVNVKDSKLDWKSTIRFQNGDTAPSNPLSKAALQSVGHTHETMECLAAWNWGGKQQFVGPPATLAEYRSEHFKIRSPKPWYNRTAGYLGVLERTFKACQSTTGRGGPDQIDIRWRHNTHNAKACVGGRNSWMSMPFRGLERATDPFRRPWFITHEMLHTFGYHHGAEMKQRNKEIAKVVDRARWLPVDESDLFTTSIELTKLTVTDEVPVEPGESVK